MNEQGPGSEPNGVDAQSEHPAPPAEQPEGERREGEAQAEARPEPAEAKPAEPPASNGTRAVEEPKKKAHPGALALLRLEKVEDDATFRLRDEGDIDSLATSLAKLGQLYPVDLRLRPPDRFQVIAGFRRVAALKLLKRERIFARVHTQLSDEDAAMMALADAVEHKSVSRDDLKVARDRLDEAGALTPAAKEAFDRAISPPDEGLAPETTEGEEEVDLDALASDVVMRIAAVNQDLSLIAELWSALDPEMRANVLEQLGYSSQLVAYLEGL